VPKAPPYLRWTINPYRGCTHACVYCFARPTHAWLELDTGIGFDSEIVVKINIVDTLRRELAHGTRAQHVALGTNTDPYQRAEGRYRLMPGIIDALAGAGQSIGILTKGTLLRRDLPLLADAAAEVPVSVAVSLAHVDPALRASIEPGAPTIEARQGLIRACRDAGFEPTVLIAPVLPYLTDGRGQLDETIAALADAGASRVSVAALHLKPYTREWFFTWLATEHPDLIERYERLYAGGAYPPKAYRTWLARRVRPMLERRGLAPRAESDPYGPSPEAAPRDRSRGPKQLSLLG
jgi:DNA repair photolyase